jgi:uncharacterized protein YnzC (UPF0291/DUF896 family)
MQRNNQNAEDYSIEAFNDLIESIKTATKLSEEEICKQLKYNEGYISQVRTRKKVSAKFIDNLKREFAGSLQNAKTPEVMHTTVQAVTMDTIKALAASNQTLSDANKRLADAHYLLAEGNTRLVNMVDKKVTADDSQQTSLELIAIRQAVVEFVIEVASGKRYKDRHEAGQAYSKKVAALIEATKGKGIQKNLGKQHIAGK